MKGLEWFSLKGKKALVTGASRRPGRAMAEALAQAGADVVCASSQLSGTDETVARIQALGRQAWQVAADFSDRSALERMALEVEKKPGRVTSWSTMLA